MNEAFQLKTGGRVITNLMVNDISHLAVVLSYLLINQSNSFMLY